MDAQQAEKIINEYGKSVARDTKPFKKKSTLPCSISRIRFAYYFYIDSLIQSNLLTQKIGEDLVATYCLLNSFIDDADAVRLNQVSEMLRRKTINPENPEDKIKLDEYLSKAAKVIKNQDCFDEINTYIRECREANILNRRQSIAQESSKNFKKSVDKMMDNLIKNWKIFPDKPE